MRVPEKFRVRSGRMASDERFGNNGLFMVPLKTNKQTVAVIASDEGGWEHVSVSRQDRCPTWGEMCEVKDLCGNDAPLLWMLHARGYDLSSLRRRETETEKLLREAQERIQQLEHEREIERRLFRDLRVSA